jgi:hypothetical protein
MERGKAACRLSRTRRVTWRTEPLKVLAAELAKLPYRVLNIKDAVHRLANKPSRPTSNVLNATELVNLHIWIGLNDVYSVKSINYFKHCAWSEAGIFSAGQSPLCISKGVFRINNGPQFVSVVSLYNKSSSQPHSPNWRPILILPCHYA